jgi:two-component system, chemotaxis family, chemotaxis protein CheY
MDPHPAAQSPDAAPRGGRVPVIDDDDAIRRVFQRYLESAGFEVVGAASGAEGLRILRNGAQVGLVLLDLMMPDMDGWRFRNAQAGDERLAAIPTVIVTGSPLSSVVHAELKAADYLLKPIGRDHLLSVAVHYCLRTHPGASAAPVELPPGLRCPYCDYSAGVCEKNRNALFVRCLSCHRESTREQWTFQSNSLLGRRTD